MSEKLDKALKNYYLANRSRFNPDLGEDRGVEEVSVDVEYTDDGDCSCSREISARMTITVRLEPLDRAVPYHRRYTYLDIADFEVEGFLSDLLEVAE